MEILKSFVDQYGNTIVLGILMISTIVFVLEACGFLPNFISEKLAKKRLISQKLLLEEMGINFREENFSRTRSGIKDVFHNKSISLHQTVSHLISLYTYKTPKKFIFGKRERIFRVGKRQTVLLPQFIDLMSASTDPNKSELMAKMLSSYLSQHPSLTFDFIITPKNGTPILGYELAKLLKVPCVFHVDSQEKFTCDNDNEFYIYSKFDVASREVLSQKKKALIVDDSTTGGRKVTNLVEDLRTINCEVNDCLVIFEPIAKEVQKTLNQIGITLHSIEKV
ncbi:hypothetical protein KVY11_14510 [Acinetobacter sp. CWB-G5]|uniref:hypothetical protein n=1 Tax=Acinetobacter sp. CWB-G5 TaxID=2855444 RepID=UPI001C46C7E8|nr:hypothetical protein [Acinetobacter sp. CWB-G5]MBV7309876.1 hypothetical protein [Acinetobacter sp. CWB-G5]